MKGVILAGGTGSRLRPVTNVINKHLLPIGTYPMIHYAIAKLADAGIEDIVLVTAGSSAGLFIQYIGSGADWGVRVSYKIQEKPGGIAQALALVEDNIRPGEKMVVLLGDNLFEDTLRPAVQQFAQSEPQSARVFLKKVHDPKRYGVPELRGGRIASIEEKPLEPKSDYCVTGVYMYDSGVFDMIRQIAPSARGELEITDVNNVYAQLGKLQYTIFDGWWTDAGTPKSMFEANARIMADDAL
ncbi:sugar phosphate nucleotidyltransferase [Paenibacillus thalictri]|uniref:Glucose-1-phosphate thymidylyltransferase n=1 Tax=Paenibacillus thalictri TaxID=2527873 RepID=A0A4Q9E143_9BACL|nr:sugar phosphate nucleotidyltransferase [Paenibacillus thalictri]TBL81883.1 spore coat protein [Paenibacillus thalictri]